jgi:cell division protein FtsA
VSEGHLVAGIDVGTTKVCTLVAAPEDATGSLEILGIGMSQSRGLKRGVVVDRQETIAAVRSSVQEAERMAEVDLHEAYVGISGDHIASTNVSARVNVAGSEVVTGDVERVLQSARDSVVLPPDREIVYVAPRGFTLDGVRDIARPVSMSGAVLDVEAHIVTGMTSVMANVARCVEEAGVRILRRALEPIATSTAVVTEAERELGVVLIDIGGGTTDIAAFLDGSIAHTSSIAVAGEHVTRDIARVLRTSMEEAESIKRRWALAVPERVSEEEMIQVVLAGSNARERVPRRLTGEIARCRVEENLRMVQEDLKRAGIYRQINGGVVLSGGGAQLPGIAQLASEMFDGLPVRIGLPRGLRGLSEAVATPAHATAVGLVMLAASDAAFISRPPEIVGLGGFQQRVLEWLTRVQDRVRRYATRR